ncbi:MAG: signal peptidase II [Aquificaceae bacterium]|nr:signal peptidase II [Aquificaceae bacterium]MDW8097026.1 signal peptidase II [Aquificaceae bacterium]
MGKSAKRLALVYGLTTLTVLSLDLTTKSLAEFYLKERDVSLLPFLHLVLVYNKGMAFGLLAQAPDWVRLPLLLLTPVVALFLTLFYALRSGSFLTAALMGMVGGGALGNLHDRALLGEVRDFVYLSYGGLSWPAFNLADASISLAIALFLLKSSFEKAGKT